MSVVVNTNIPSISASRILTNNRADLERAMERLSSGKRINSAKDDAAGSAVAAKLRADITSINQAVRNTNDGISLLNTYDGAASEIENILTRMRELAVQAKTGTYQASDMALANKEYDQLKVEIRRIAQVTSFNRLNVANGTASSNGTPDKEDVAFTFFVGARVQDEGNSITFSAGTLDLNNLTAVTGAGTGGDFTSATLELTESNQVGGLGTIASNATVGDSTSGVFGGDAAGGTSDNASAALVQIDHALDLLASKRATAGALVNRLEHTVSNLLNVNQRLQEAESRIRDADYAAESANLARGMVLAQAGTAMLAQANQQPQYILQLLK
jgi:flagellin